jgi:DNA-binding PadR family transcriptional regulator
MSTQVGVFELLVLMAVASTGDEAYGVRVRQTVAASRGTDVSSGAVYTTLERLEQRGFVVSRRGEATTTRSGRPRRYYRLTKAGEGAVQTNFGALRDLARQLNPRLTRP